MKSNSEVAAQVSRFASAERVRKGEMLRAKLRRLDREYHSKLRRPMSKEEIGRMRDERYKLSSEISEIEKLADELEDFYYRNAAKRQGDKLVADAMKVTSGYRKMTEQKIPTHDEARVALNSFCRYEADLATIDLMEGIIREIRNRVIMEPNYPINISVGQIEFSYRRNDILRSAERLGIGPLEPPKWMDRFMDLCEEIRKEQGLERCSHTPE